MLQHFEMGAEVKYLSISGSAVNRFGTVSKLSAEALAAFGASLALNFGVHLEKPNDIVVEDTSVDLSNAALPPEFSQQTSYEHVRSYVDCVDVGHTSIHKDPHVIERLQKWISEATSA